MSKVGKLVWPCLLLSSNLVLKRGSEVDLRKWEDVALLESGEWESHPKTSFSD